MPSCESAIGGFQDISIVVEAVAFTDTFLGGPVDNIE